MASVKPRKKTRRKDSAFVYVLGCLAGARHLTYVGWTNDVTRRLAKHNAGTGARSTRGRTWVLLHSERFADKRAAMSREWHLKRDRGFRKQLAQALRERTKT
ncbi:MAG TPA: GIY-YIG nuclease family protein [Pseudolabrys sp.]|nr:GIY-YIG nuclease family protein [Pseudolabrys sp.]